MNMPPDGFVEGPPDGFVEGPPDGFEEGPPDGFEEQDSLLNRSADTIRGVEGSIGNAVDAITPNAWKMYKESPLYQASPIGLLNKANDYIHKGADWIGEKAATGLASRGANPYIAAALGTGLQMAPDIAATAATARIPEVPSSYIADRGLPSLLKSTKGIPTNVTKMALKDPGVMDLPGTSASIQGKSQDIINAIKEAQSKVGSDFGKAYSEQGIKSPVDQVVNGKTPTKSILKSRSYEVPGEDVQKTQHILGRSYKTSPTPIFGGVNPSEITKEIPGESVSIPGRSYTYSEEGPNKTVSHSDVSDTVPNPGHAKSFDELRNDYHAAMSGDLFKQSGTAGGYSEMPNTDKLASLTELKRSLQDQAIYPPAGQQLSPSQGATNAAIKKMAADIDQVRGNLPGGDKLALADDAWHEMSGLKQQLMSAFKDPYTGQDYLNRILKGNTDWLTSGRMAGKIGAIERIEQMTGKQVLQPALKEMAAAYLKNPDVMSLPSMSLKSIISSFVPTHLLMKGAQGLRNAPSIEKTVAMSSSPLKSGWNQANEPEIGSKAVADKLPQPAPHGKVVEQDGKRYKWDGFEYVEQ
jgi:hypothetical protein